MNHLNWLLSMWRSSSSSTAKGESSHPAEETHLSHLDPQSCSFSHYPQLVTIGEGWNKDQPVNRELCLLAQLSLHHNRPVQSPDHSRQCTNPSLDLLHSPITQEQDPKILELLHLRQNLTPTWTRHPTLFRLSTMVSDLEVLILTPATSHSAANHSSEN